MIYKVWVKEGIPRQAYELDTSNDVTAATCMTGKEYFNLMKDIIVVIVLPVIHGKKENGRGFDYYVESETLGGAVSKVDRILLADRLRG